MLLKINTYKKLLAVCIVLCYLTGTFRELLLEGLHTLSHVSEEMASTWSQHRFHDHSEGHGHHHHHFLESLHILLDLLMPAIPLPDKKTGVSKKKFAAYCCQRPELFFPSVFSPAQPDYYLFYATSFYPPVPSPPPRVG